MNSVVLIIVIIVLVFLLILITEYNKFKRLQNKVKQSKSTIDVYLTKRFDLVPNLVECVKEYSRYEESLFEKITKIRSRYKENKDLEDGKNGYIEFNNVIATIEKYPELKASEQFLSLQNNLQKIENELQAARRLYNGDVTLYNTTIETFPNSLFAKLFSYKTEKLFEVEDYNYEKVNVKF